MQLERSRRIEKLSVGAFVGRQIEPARRCWAPKASVGSQIEPASTLLGAQAARAGRPGQPDRASRSQIEPARASQAHQGRPDRASRGQIEPARAPRLRWLVAQLTARMPAGQRVEQFRYGYIYIHIYIFVKRRRMPLRSILSKNRQNRSYPRSLLACPKFPSVQSKFTH